MISYGTSTKDFSANLNSYTTVLLNQCALVEFTTNEIPVETAVSISGMKNKLTVDFDGNTLTPSEETGSIKLHAASTTSRWAILLPDNSVTTTATAEGYNATENITVPSIAINSYLTGTDGVSFEMTAAPAEHIVDLSELTSNITLEDGYILTGTLDGANNADQRIKISIADGATITLSDAHIIGYLDDNTYYQWAGLNCLGDATIIIDDGTTNEVQGSNYAYPGIHIPANKTLTINANGSGTGTLDASCISPGAGGAGIGAIDNTYGGGTCGNIVINGGVITATGAPGYSSGSNSGLPGGAGIGGAPNTSCGTITITGGTVNATGGIFAAGIGTSSGTQDGVDYYSNCGAITITGGDVTAHGGLYAAGIGAGYNKCSSSTCNCESVTITGGTVTATGGGTDNLFGAGIGSGYASTTTAKSTCGNISISTSETVTATGGKYAAGIGSGYVYGKQKLPTSSCGNIEITAGTVIATGGQNGAGIGTGYKQFMGTCSCGTITIGTGVTSVTATKGNGATNSIGVGKSGTCGTVTIGGVVGVITDSPYTYQP